MVALAVLHLSLTFYNVWPTLAIRWQGEWSVELAAGLLLLAAVSRIGRPPSRWWLRAATAAWLLLVVGRYAQVMAPSLYGREVNLYWDTQHMSAVAAMIARVASMPLLVAASAAALAAIAGAYWIGRWALGHVAHALAAAQWRWTVVLPAIAFVVLFGISRILPSLPAPMAFVVPVTQTYARQVQFILEGMGRANGADPLPESPTMMSSLAHLQGADVVVLFIESYGAVSFDRPTFASRLAPSRATFETAIRETDRDVVSTFVTSPTFGGSSWLAHISLMTGIEVKDADTNARLMNQDRVTLATFFRSRGYRAVAFMPGLSQNWPEGAFYKFDDIFDATRLGYHGPEFGWWTIPDQFSLASLRNLELSAADRPPVFAMLPTISTHTPFKPTPPYQPDWSRVTTAEPFDVAAVERSMAEEPDWENLSPSYADSLEYAYTTLSGFLREARDRDLVLIVLGDHQPPALVSGEGARWEVPVHIVSSRRDVLAGLEAQGFTRGLAPASATSGPMHGLVPRLMTAFGPPVAAADTSAGR